MTDKIRRHYANVVATIALVVALTGGTAWALSRDSVGKPQLRANSVGASELRTGATKSRDIARNTIRAADLATQAVGTDELATASVQSTDLATGAVQADALGLPGPVQFEQDTVQSATVDNTAAELTAVGTVDKVAADSVLRVAWSGVAAAGFFPCVFQLRVDGASGGAGEVYVQNGSTTSVSVEGLFSGLAPGAHQVEIWARVVGSSGSASYPCTLNGQDVTQTVIAEEVVF